jgi:hypothetical protein
VVVSYLRAVSHLVIVLKIQEGALEQLAPQVISRWPEKEVGI